MLKSFRSVYINLTVLYMLLLINYEKVTTILAIFIYIHTYMKFITRCIVEDGSNQKRALLLGGGV